MQDAELWKRRKAHRFDATEGSEPFSVKLAAAEGWDKSFTRQVINEYRKFLYLSQVSPEQVTPSVAVDRAWHMHLTFTRDYWEVLCPEVLQADLHHEPCAGSEEMPRYEAQYRVTRDLYEQEFGAPPPPAIWPNPDHVPPKTWIYLLSGGPVVMLVGVALLNFDMTLLGIVLLLVGLCMLGAAFAVMPGRAARRGDGGGVWVGGCGAGGKGGASDGGAGGCGGGGCGGGGG